MDEKDANSDGWLKSVSIGPRKLKSILREKGDIEPNFDSADPADETSYFVERTRRRRQFHGPARLEQGLSAGKKLPGALHGFVSGGVPYVRASEHRGFLRELSGDDGHLDGGSASVPGNEVATARGDFEVSSIARITKYIPEIDSRGCA